MSSLETTIAIERGLLSIMAGAGYQEWVDKNGTEYATENGVRVPRRGKDNPQAGQQGQAQSLPNKPAQGKEAVAPPSTATPVAPKEAMAPIDKVAIKSALNEVQQLGEKFKAIAPEQQQKIKDYLKSPDTVKARETVANAMSAADPLMAKAFAETNKAVSAIFDKTPLEDAFTAAGKIVDNTIQFTKDNPGIVAAGALGAIGMIVGGAGAVALFSVPNVLGYGALLATTEAALSGAGVVGTMGALVAGSASQLGFVVSLAIAAQGALAMVQAAKMTFSKEYRDKIADLKEYTTVYHQMLAEKDPKKKKELQDKMIELSTKIEKANAAESAAKKAPVKSQENPTKKQEQKVEANTRSLALIKDLETALSVRQREYDDLEIDLETEIIAYHTFK